MDPRRLLHPRVVETLLKIVQDRFLQEILFYTHRNMATTTQDAGKEHEDQWTTKMYDHGIIQKLEDIKAPRQELLDLDEATRFQFNEFLKLVRTHTTLHGESLLEMSAQEAYAKVSSDGISSENFLKIHKLLNSRFVELERTLTALYNILLLDIPVEEAYAYFKAAQYDYPQDRQISLSNFKKIHELRNSIVNPDPNNPNSENLELLIYFIIYSDFGKSPQIRELLRELHYDNLVDPTLPPDDLISAILNNFDFELQIEDVLPSFAKLSDFNKKRIKEYYPLMGPCFGHIMFYERGQRIFEMIAEVLLKIGLTEREYATKLLFLAQFGDGMGAQGQGRINGSATCNNDFYETYQLMYDSLLILEKELGLGKSASVAAETAFNMNLVTRAKWLGFSAEESAEEKQMFSHQEEVLIRVGAMIRCPKDANSAALLQASWENDLTDTQRKVMIEQLSFHPETLPVWSEVASNIPKGLESWTRVDYLATAPLNLAQDLMKKGETANAIRAGMRGSACVAMMLDYLAKTYPDVLKDPKRAISLGIFASFTRDNPDFYNPDTFDVKRCKFNFQTNKIEIGPSVHVSQSLLSAVTPPPPANTVASEAALSLNISSRHG